MDFWFYRIKMQDAVTDVCMFWPNTCLSISRQINEAVITDSSYEAMGPKLLDILKIIVASNQVNKIDS